MAKSRIYVELIKNLADSFNPIRTFFFFFFAAAFS